MPQIPMSGAIVSEAPPHQTILQAIESLDENIRQLEQLLYKILGQEATEQPTKDIRGIPSIPLAEFLHNAHELIYAKKAQIHALTEELQRALF